MNSKTGFKQTEIGEIPENWEVKELQDICILITDGKHGDCKNQEGSGYYFLSAKDVINGNLDYSNAREITKVDFLETHRRTNLEPGDILLSNSGTIGRLAIAKDSEKTKRTTFQKSVAIVKPNRLITDSYFIYYYLLSKKRYIINLAEGTTQQNLLLGDLRTFKIGVPNLITQKKVIHVLYDIDSKIELNQKINKTLESIGQTLFKHWFIDFEFPDKGGKPYKSSGGEMVYSEELEKEIPKGWRVGTLEEVLSTLESGIRPKGGIDKYFEGIPSIGAENILGLGKYNYSKTKYVPLDFFNLMKYGIIQDGDVLLYKDGAKIGRKSIFMHDFPFKECCINEHVFILRTNRLISPTYLYFWLDQNWMTEEIRNLNSNSAQPGINKQGVNSLMILIPELEIINRFDKFCSSLIAKIFRNCLQNLTLSKIRDALLPKLMSGQIRINVSEIGNKERTEEAVT